VPIYLSNNERAVMMDVVLGGQSVRMQIDTGAGMMQINSDLAYRIVAEGQGSWGDTQTFQVADGRFIKNPTLTINSVRIGRHEVKQVKAAVADGYSSLLMSFPVLNAIGPFTINTRTLELIFDLSVATVHQEQHPS
jgi:predicted aspartyl protease